VHPLIFSSILAQVETPDPGLKGWLVAGVIVVVGLLVIGFSDLVRLSWTRIWAISGVCFDESIRRRVLWITPLAMLGILVVTQLQRPVDEQDVIRSTLKISLFCTGLVVVLSSIILACTNLPKEIENRVIFTVVTKPTTRLEVILGKIVGFSRVSAAVLIIMGLFTWSYVHVRAWSLQSSVSDRLDQESLSSTERATLEHYQKAGLLNVRSYSPPFELNMYSRSPFETGDKVWLNGQAEEDCLIPFDLSGDDNKVRDELFPDGPHSGAGQYGIVIGATVGWERSAHPTTTEQNTPDADLGAPPFRLSRPNDQPPFLPGAQLKATMAYAPTVSFDLDDAHLYQLALPAQLQPITKSPNVNEAIMPLSNDGSPREVQAWIPPTIAESLYPMPRYYVRVACMPENYEINVSRSKDLAPAWIALPDPSKGKLTRIEPHRNPDGNFSLAFHGRPARTGQELRGGPAGEPCAVETFINAKLPAAVNGVIPFEFTVAIDREGGAASVSSEDATDLQFDFHDKATGKVTTVEGLAENRRTLFLDVPADALTSGNFDVLIRCKTLGHSLGMFYDNLLLVSSQESFTFNLTKSLFVMWMMTVLVVVIAVFSSTFLSWPIAIVLTVVLLLGHWGVNTIGASSGGGLGRQIVQDMFGARPDPATSKAISESVEALNNTLNRVAMVLPDISKFDAIDDIEKGWAVRAGTLLDAATVLFMFGLPLSVGAYLVLRNKEVAP
jgi:ABC-type transport system involved in multi-copper enzyme maturation permease subunit